MWENAHDKLEPGIRHPLDSVQEPNQGEICVFSLTESKKCSDNLAQYCIENDIDVELVDKIARQIFDNYDSNSGAMLVPDLTSMDPSKSLLNYSVSQYVMDNPDITEALRRGLIPSEFDHFLRCGYFEILKGRRYSSLCLF